MRNIIPKGGYVTDYSQLLAKVLQLEKIINEGGGGGGSSSDNTYYYYVNSERDIDGPYSSTPIHMQVPSSPNDYEALVLNDVTDVELYNEILQHLKNGDKVVFKALDVNFNNYYMEAKLNPNGDSDYAKGYDSVSPKIIVLVPTAYIDISGYISVMGIIPFGYYVQK